MSKPAKLVLLPALLVLLTACEHGAGIVMVSCEVGNAVSVSKSDRLTEQTASEIEANNRSREAAGCKPAKTS